MDSTGTGKRGGAATVKPETEVLSQQGEKRHRVEDESNDSDVPPHVLRQRMLNKSTLGALSRALSQDPAADLTIVLTQASETYASKRRKASDPRPLTRKNRLAREVNNAPTECEGSPPPPTVIYPLAANALHALGLCGSSSAVEIECALISLPQSLKHGEILFKLFGRQITRLQGAVVVKSGTNLDHAEHYLLDYLQRHCPTMRSPVPLGFVVVAGISYFFMTHVPGLTLHSRWSSMSELQKKAVCSQLNGMLSDLHNLSWAPGTPLGSLTNPHTCKDLRNWTRSSGHIRNEAEFNDFLLRWPRKGIAPSYLTWLRSRLRDDHRIILAHGDLNPKNIILVDGENDTVSVSGIVDWEMGGWYPEYWDSLKALNSRGTNDDSDWWCSLPEQINQHVAEVALDSLIEYAISA